MSKLCLMGKNALKSRVWPLNPTRILPSSRSFSTEGEEHRQDFSSGDHQGSVFGTVNLFTKDVMKTDIFHFFEGCNLSPADIKVEYNKAYNPVCIMLKFPSQSYFDLAFRQTIRKGYVFTLDRVDCSQWELLPSYDSKSVLLQGIPRDALPQDVQRFLAGSNFDPNFQIFEKPVSRKEFVRSTIVQFPTAMDAMSAFLMKNKNFCLNSPVTMRVLH